MGTPELELQCLLLKVNGGTRLAMDTCELGRAIEGRYAGSKPLFDGPGSWRHRVKKGWGVAGRHRLAVCPGESLLCCVIMWMANNDRLHLWPQVQRAVPGSRTTTRSVERKWRSPAFGHRTRLLPCGSVWEDDGLLRQTTGKWELGLTILTPPLLFPNLPR